MTGAMTTIQKGPFDYDFILVGYICSTYIPAVHIRLPSSTRSCSDLYSIQLDMTTCVCLWFSDYTLVSLNNKTDRYVHNNWNIVSSEIHVYIKWKLNCTSFLVSLLYVVHFDSPTFVCNFNVPITIYIFLLFTNYPFTTGSNISDKSDTNIFIKEQKTYHSHCDKSHNILSQKQMCLYWVKFQDAVHYSKWYGNALTRSIRGTREQNIEFRTKPIMSFMCWATISLLLYYGNIVWVRWNMVLCLTTIDSDLKHCILCKIGTDFNFQCISYWFIQLLSAALDDKQPQYIPVPLYLWQSQNPHPSTLLHSLYTVLCDVLMR
jgi:hypothetical protein